jgi:thiamine pyrophosphokinase
MHIVIFAGGILQPGKEVDAAIATADLIIAADSGATTALRYGCAPSFIIGDLDSLDIDQLQQVVFEADNKGSQIIQSPIEKNETDTELAVQFAIGRGATSITLLGALGGVRFDHTIANILLLAGFETVPIRIVDGPSIGWILRGPGSTTISGQKGDLLSLLPLSGDAIGIHTVGLYYPLDSETLYFGKPRGVSNVLTSESAEVSLQSGMLLVVHTDAQELGDRA